MARTKYAATNQSLNTTATLNYFTATGSSPTAGELLLAFLVTNVGQASHTPPSGWTEIESSPLGSGNLFATWYYKISDGTETAVTWSWPTSSTATFVITAWDDAVTVLDDSADDETDISTIVTTYDTGSASASVASGRVFAFFGVDSGLNVDGGRAYNNSFVESFASFAAAAARGGAFCATKAITATGADSCQFTCTDTGDEGYGTIAMFVTPAAGGQPFVKRSAGVPGMRLNKGIW